MNITKFNINAKGTDYFVGDIHGEFTQFMQALAAVDFDFEVDRVFSVGDLIDRGPDSLKCLQLVEREWFFAVQGNHEDMMLGNQGWQCWMQNGGGWSQELQDTRPYEALIQTHMPLRMEVDTLHGRIGVVHAECGTNWQIEVDTERMLWARNKITAFNTDNVEHIERVVVGHTPLEKVVRLGNVIYIDTGAVFDDGFLTLMSVEEVFNHDHF